MSRLHLTRSCASSHDSPLHQLVPDVIQQPPLRSSPSLPGIYITIILLLTYSSSLLNIWPYHFHLLSCIFLDMSSTFVVPLNLSFPILSSLVSPLTHLNILIFTTSNFFSCAFFTVHAGLNTVLYTFPWTLKLILRLYRVMCPKFNSMYSVGSGTPSI